MGCPLHDMTMEMGTVDEPQVVSGTGIIECDEIEFLLMFER